MPAAVQGTAAFHRRVPRHLLHPTRVRVSGDAAQRHPATADLDEEQNVVRDEPSPCQHFDREEVCASEHVHMRPDELLPGGRATPFRRWCDRVSTENVAHSLVTSSAGKRQRPFLRKPEYRTPRTCVAGRLCSSTTCRTSL